MTFLSESYYLVLGAFALVYLGVYLFPFLLKSLGQSPRKDLERLTADLRAELDRPADPLGMLEEEEEEEEDHEHAEGEERAYEHAEDEHAEDEYAEYEHAEDGYAEDGYAGYEYGESEEDYDEQEEDEDEEYAEVESAQEEHIEVESAQEEYVEVSGAAPRASRQAQATRHLYNLPPLAASYRSDIVQEAVEQVRAQYPAGAYQRFRLEALPWYGAYAERAAAARNMASLFVLIGLGLTMIRLNGVVGRISEVSSASKNSGVSDASGASQMSSDVFLGEMGRIMNDIGGAFLASIWGLALMVAALLVIGLVDRVVQRRLQRLEQTVVLEAIPLLTRLHERYMPSLTLPDLLADTGEHLLTLNHAVGGLTDGLARTLSGLSDQIDNMLDNFRSFQQQYVMLNDLLKHLGEASTNLKDTTRAIDGAARRLVDPVDECNATLLRHLETVADAVSVSREGHEVVSGDLAQLHARFDALLAEVREHSAGFYERGLAQQEATRAEMEEYIKYLITQSEKVERQMEAAAEAFRASTPPQLAATLQDLGTAVGALNATASRLGDLDVSPSLFAWSARMAKRGHRWVTSGNAGGWLSSSGNRR